LFESIDHYFVQEIAFLDREPCEEEVDIGMPVNMSFKVLRKRCWRNHAALGLIVFVRDDAELNIQDDPEESIAADY
jgi:hypothetical protein